MSLTGDALTDWAVRLAQTLVWAVREGDAECVAQVLTEARDEAGRAAVDALVIVLAAMVPDDLPPSELLAWRTNPAEYLRLREAGVGSYAAASLCRQRPNMEAA